MNLRTIEMDKPKAREAFLDYKRQVERRHTDEDAAILAGYKELARGRQLIALSEVMRDGGLEPRETQWRTWSSNNARVDHRGNVLLPKLAVMRADQRECTTRAVAADGSVTFIGDDSSLFYTGRRSSRRLIFGPRTFAPHSVTVTWNPTFRAMVPLIPPALRPGQTQLHRYHVLWEAEWEETTRPPVAPRDPALLKHIGGDLYAVLAIWDLTSLERAVLSGRR